MRLVSRFEKLLRNLKFYYISSNTCLVKNRLLYVGTELLEKKKKKTGKKTRVCL